MTNQLNHLPRVLPFGSTYLQAAGAGRMSGSALYLNPTNNKVIELLLGHVVHAGHVNSTVAFENASIPPALIRGNAEAHQLRAGDRVLVEPRLGVGTTEAAHWFKIGGKAPTPQPVKPVMKTVTAVITSVEPGFRYAWATTAAGLRYFVSATERRDGRPFLLNAKVQFIPSHNAKGPYALNVTAA